MQIEGAITMAVAVIAFFVLPDFPHNVRWGFSKEEKQLAVQRMTEDVGMKDDTSKISNWDATKLALCDYKRASHLSRDVPQISETLRLCHMGTSCEG